MFDNVLFGPFLSKLNKHNIELVEDFYSDKDFVDFYNGSLKSESYDDIRIYERLLAKNDSILEIGSGSGRIFNKLALSNLNIYGIEPSVEMNKYIAPGYSSKVYNIRVQDILNYKEKLGLFTKIIIPATTVSLFPHHEFIDIIGKLKRMLVKGGAIIFDFINPIYLNTINGQVNIGDLRGNKVFFANYIEGDKFYLNIYLKGINIEKLSYSVKHLYDFEFLERLAVAHNLSIRQIFENELYVMVEMKK